METKKQLIKSSLLRARSSYNGNQYGQSFAYFLLAIKLAPEQKENLKKEFGDVFREWLNDLSRQGRSHDVFECYAQALDVFPENEWVQNTMGSYLYRLGFTDEAVPHYRQALVLNPNMFSARECLYNLCNVLVERWHFRMLNDKCRNTAFKEAIHRAIKSGHQTVLDIGAGTGILSMFAVQAGVREVHACEMSKTMTSIAQDILLANQMVNTIQLLQMKSTDMHIPEHIPKRVSLVVTETVDSGLLGEGILDTLHHAWNNLLLPPDEQGGGGKVIPSGATVFGVLVESDYIQKHHRLISKSIGNLYFDIMIISTSVGVTDIQDSQSSGSEPYTSEQLSLIPSGYTALSDIFTVQEFNFNNPQEVADFQCNRSVPKPLYIPVTKAGTLDAIVTWFDLHLDLLTSISTAPWSESCWEKAVYPLHERQIKVGADVCQVN